MTKLNNNNLKLAIQKSGRLADASLRFLRSAGLDVDSYQAKLFASCRNFPLEIIYVRDDDIPGYVASGSVDIGMVGQNLLYEERPENVKKLLNLRYGFCALTLAVPRESQVTELTDLAGQTIATSYPNSTQRFFQKNGLAVETIKITGSVEITPALGVAQGIVDLTATGSTMALNDLRPLTKLYDSEAVLIANSQVSQNLPKQKLIDQLLVRFKAVLSAKDYKYVLFNVPNQVLPKIKKLISGLDSPTIAPLIKPNWSAVQTVIKEAAFWQTVEKLKQAGATGVMVLPIEKIIN